MKNIFVTLLAFAAVSCGNASQSQADSTAAAPTQTETAMAAAPADENTLMVKIDGTGVGPVKLGMTLTDLPMKVDGLYDKIVEENSDMVLYSFYLNDETVMITNGDGKIEVIEVFPALTNVLTPDGVRQGMKEADFRRLSGWKDNGEGGYTKDGVTVVLMDGEVANMQAGSFYYDI